MTLQLPKTAEAYDSKNEADARSALIQADGANLKRGSDIDMKAGRIYLYDANGQRYVIGVSTAGAVTATAV